MPLRVFACYECENDSPCVLISDIDPEHSPERCPMKGQAVWKELRYQEADA